MVARSAAAIVVELVAQAWSMAGVAQRSTSLAPMSRVTNGTLPGFAVRKAVAAATWLPSG